MKPFDDLSAPGWFPGFYVHAGAIRYFRGNLAPRTLTRETPLILPHGTFYFGAIVNNDALVAYVSPDRTERGEPIPERNRVRDTVHVHHGYVTTVKYENHELYYCLNPKFCWGMENGIPRHKFAPEILDDGDQYRVLLTGLGIFQGQPLSRDDEIAFKELEKELKDIVAYKENPQSGIMPGDMNYLDLERRLAYFANKYSNCLRL